MRVEGTKCISGQENKLSRAALSTSGASDSGPSAGTLATTCRVWVYRGDRGGDRVDRGQGQGQVPPPAMLGTTRTMLGTTHHAR